MSPIEETVRTFIIKNFLFGEDDTLKGNTSFLEEGIIDSTGILELVMFLEETYSFKIEDSQIVPDNFETLENITRFLEEKVGIAG